MSKLVSLLFLIFMSNPLAWGISYNEALEIHHVAQSTFEAQRVALNIKNIELLLNHEDPYNWGGAQLKEEMGVISIGADLLPDLTKEEFQFIYCHELGHFLGGEPKKKDSWASTEAQADYWAGAECLRAFYPMMSKNAYIETISVSMINFFGKVREQLGAEIASLQFYRQPLMDSPEKMTFESEYSSFQCRYDTVMSGARRQPKPACLTPQ